MEYDYQREIDELLSKPEWLKQEVPYTRCIEESYGDETLYGKYVEVGEKIDVMLPSIKREVIPYSQLAKELDPNSHDVLFDENIPSICVKVAKDDYREVKHKRMAIPFQKIIKNVQLIYLTNYSLQFTQVDRQPTKQQDADYTTFKQYWELRNQDGMKNKMVDAQLSYGYVGLLYYFNRKKELKSRLLTYPEYRICSHNDKNGERLLESIYYKRSEYINDQLIDVEYIDSYDDTYLYRYRRATNVTTTTDSGWVLEPKQKHGFSEIPLITKRGKVAWEGGQTAIEAYEELFNVFNAIQKRFGWGIFYIKGRFKEDTRRIAGSVVLNDVNTESGSDAKFLTPPTPEGMFDTLKNLMRTIQLSTSTTFILPDDIHISGDVSGIAVQLTKELDLQNAMQKVIDWQNVADKMVRLFKEGLAIELVSKGIQPTAITDFANLHISGKFKVWRPFSEMEYNNMVQMLTNSGLLSKESGIELNTLSKPDEKMRIDSEAEEAFKKEQELAMQSAESTQNNKQSENGNVENITDVNEKKGGNEE